MNLFMPDPSRWTVPLVHHLCGLVKRTSYINEWRICHFEVTLTFLVSVYIVVDTKMFCSSFVLITYRRRQEGQVRLSRVPQAHHREGHHCHGQQVPPGVLRLHLLQEGKPSCNDNSSPTDVSPIDVSWILRPLDKASPGYCVPD